jgi:hypothetical protein
VQSIAPLIVIAINEVFSGGSSQACPTARAEISTQAAITGAGGQLTASIS